MKLEKIYFKSLFLIIAIFCGNLNLFATASQLNYNPKRDTKSVQVSNFSSYSNFKKLGDTYSDKEDFANAIYYYQKALLLNRNEQDLNRLGFILYMYGDYNNSLKCFELAHKLNSQNEKTEKKIRYLNSIIAARQKDNSYDLVEPEEKAPVSFHVLIKVQGQLKNPKSEEELHKIFDLIWSDKDGKILIRTAMKNRVPIYLTSKTKYSNMESVQFDFSKAKNVGINALLSSYSNLTAVNGVTIKETDITGFQEKGTSLAQNASAVMIVAHEFCHLLRCMNYSTTLDSQEEEMDAYILGSDLASRVLTGKPLDESEIKELATVFYNGVFKPKNSIYSKLPPKNNFYQKMQSVGIELPQYEVYSDFKQLEFKENRNNSGLQRYIAKLDERVSGNFDSFLSKRSVYIVHRVYLSRKGKIFVMNVAEPKSLKNIAREDIFNLELAAFQEPFPEDYQDDLIPIEICRMNKKVKIRLQELK